MRAKKILRILYPILIVLIAIDVFFWDDMSFLPAVAIMSILTLTIIAIVVLEFIVWNKTKE